MIAVSQVADPLTWEPHQRDANPRGRGPFLPKDVKPGDLAAIGLPSRHPEHNRWSRCSSCLEAKHAQAKFAVGAESYLFEMRPPDDSRGDHPGDVAVYGTCLCL